MHLLVIVQNNNEPILQGKVRSLHSHIFQYYQFWNKMHYYYYYYYYYYYNCCWLFYCVYVVCVVIKDGLPVSAVYRGPKKKLENYRNKRFVSFKTGPKREWALTWWNPAAQTRPVLGSSPSVPVHTLPRKIATILLLAFSLFELVAALSQCFCSEIPYLL